MRVAWQRPRGRRIAVLLSAFTLLGILPNQAQGVSPAGGPAAHRRAVTVTLVTGDKVALGEAASGAPTVSVTPAKRPGRHVGFITARAGNDLYVIPSDARRSFGGLFDPDLFDVTKWSPPEVRRGWGRSGLVVRGCTAGQMSGPVR